MAILDPYRDHLAALKRRGRLRGLQAASGLDFSSNDYLGLARDPAIATAVADAIARGVPIGAGGSRLLRGNAPEHEALEHQAAMHFGAEAALWLANGFAANAGMIAALPRAGDRLFIDALIHASVHDGLGHSRASHAFIPHNDATAFDDAITRWRADGGTGRPWIVAETLYSMDGDCAPIADLVAVARRHDGMLLLDEAHSTGICGTDGRGLAADWQGADNLITLHTCGKGLGTEGAIVCAARPLIDTLVNKARPFIYSTAPSPLMAVATGAALERVRGPQGDALRARLLALRETADRVLCHPLGLPPTQSQILPVLLGDDTRALQVAAGLQAAGFDIRAIRPPTVAAGTARLRISLTLNVDADAIEALANALMPLMQRETA